MRRRKCFAQWFINIVGVASNVPLLFAEVIRQPEPEPDTLDSHTRNYIIFPQPGERERLIKYPHYGRYNTGGGRCGVRLSWDSLPCNLKI